MISVDVNANKNNNKKRSGGCISQIFIRSTFKTWKHNVKRACIFDLILFSIRS